MEPNAFEERARTVMKHWKWIVAAGLAATACVIVAMPTAAVGAEKAAAVSDEVAERPGDYCGICESKKRVTEVAPWLKVGADFRARLISQDAIGLQDRAKYGVNREERLWQRFRTRVWATATMPEMENMEFNVRLVDEFRNFCRPKRGVAPYKRSTNFDEIIFDKFNIRIKNLMEEGITLTVGRQDFRLGSGWMFFEGTPMDGSRTIYFDAARATVDLPDYKSTLDVIFIDQEPHNDRFIRPINNRDNQVASAHERGVIVYVQNKSMDHMQVDGYFAWKHNMKDTSKGVYLRSTTDADIYTVGARAVGEYDENWGYDAEIAPQFGEKANRDITSLGARARLTYTAQDALKSQFYLDYEYRSGGKTPNQSFDILWGRYPYFSEAYCAYIDGLEGPLGASANMHRVGPGFRCVPWEQDGVSAHEKQRLDFEAKYNLLFAERNNLSGVALGGTRAFSTNGHFRGHLVTAILKHRLSQHIRHYVLGEVFLPGNYYSRYRNDTSVFGRYEIMFSW
jgi:alginate export protein